MIGLRTCEGNKFENFFKIVQKAADMQNCVFFLDCGECHFFENEVMEGEDLRGWLVPKEKADEFNTDFLKHNDRDDWERYICWAVWKNENDPQIEFEWY